MGTRTTTEYLPALFDSREAAEAALHDLQRLGLTEANLGVAVLELEPGWYRLLDEEEHVLVKGIERGLEGGVPAGMIAGIAVAAAVTPGGAIISGGLLAGAIAGAIWGAIMGAWGGVIWKAPLDADEDHWVNVSVGRGDVLVIAHPGRHYDETHAILTRHGARSFIDPEQPEHPLRLESLTVQTAVPA